VTDAGSSFSSRYAGAESSPGFLLWKVANLHQTLQRRALAELELTPTQFSVLACFGDLSSKGPVTQSDVCRHAALDKMLVSDATRALITKGLLTRVASQVDRRSAVISLTDAGWAQCNRALQIIEPLDRAFFATSDDPGALAGQLQAILRASTG
jgi:DNA-binding MarR family transcriptional regulator